MKITAVEFRFRYLIHTLIYVLGFFAPWNYVVPLDPRGPNAHLWGVLSAALAKHGMGNIGTAFDLTLVFAIVCASAGAFLRTWGAAYLGSGIVADGAMHTAEGATTPGIVADGPYRYMRNPLYVGTFLHTLAVMFLMPTSGAIWTVVMIGVLQIRLMLGEEAFLTSTLGAPYVAYWTLVPRIVPSLKPLVQASGKQARWGQAFVGEVYFWGVACSFAFAGWRYSGLLLMQCLLVSFGLSFVAMAFVRRPGAVAT